MLSVPPVNRVGAGLLHCQKGTTKRGWTSPNFGRGRSVQLLIIGVDGMTNRDVECPSCQQSGGWSPPLPEGDCKKGLDLAKFW